MPAIRIAAAAAATASLALALAAPARADDAALAQFFKGKTVTVHFGGGVGGSYWLYSQLAATYLGKHIPGNPKAVIQSMPGARGMKGLNYSFNVAPRDGTFITMAHAEVLQETVLNPKAKFDAKKYRWLGRFTNIDSVGVASKASGVKSLDDAKKREVIVGATGFRSWTGFSPMLFNRVAGTKFKIVAGYKGATQMFHAMDQKEVEVVPASWVVVKVNKAKQLAAGELVPIFAIALDRMAELPDVPTITEFGRDEEEKLFLRVFAANGVIGRALAAPPGTDAARVASIRTAFDRMLADPKFQAHVKDKKIPLNTLPGPALAQKVKSVLAMSDDQVGKTRALYNTLLAGKKGKK
jgi:tripartite-type tricarboxylate transporter receptor subunit TctC